MKRIARKRQSCRLAEGVDARSRQALTRLVLLTALLALAAAAAPAAAQAVSFSGPTNFPASNSPASVAVGHFNGDSQPDLAVANHFSSNVSILLGNGSGGFTGPTNFNAGNRPLSVAVGHFNGDSRPDLAVANYRSDDVSILLGDGSGNFTGPTNLPAGSNPASVAVGDFDAGSQPDLAVANYGSTNVSVLLGDGLGSFGAATNFPAGSNPTSVAVGDLDGDSQPDLAVANRGSSNVSILLGDGLGSFGAATDFPAGSNPTWVAVGDLDSDSCPDLALANFYTTDVSVLLNTTPVSCHKPAFPLDSASGPPLPNAVHSSLVPNFRQTIDDSQCQYRGGALRLHGSPLAFSSCTPPELVPVTQAHMGNQSVGSVDIVGMPGTPGAPDDADIAISASATDVRDGSASGPPYDPVATPNAQDMSLVARVRISDDFNDNPSAPLLCASSTSCPATLTDFTLSAPVSCAPNGPGSDCNVATTADGLIPDFVKENQQTTVQVFRPRLRDAGADNDPASAGDNKDAFMQGLYIRDVPAAAPPPYDVPQSADDIGVRFVPNYRQTIDDSQCSARGGYPGTHGAPDLAPPATDPDRSCSPPAYLPDTIARIEAATWGGLSVIPGDANPFNGDQADASIRVSATDVRDQNGNEYLGNVGLVEKMRITDEFNCTPGPGCPGTYQEPGTVLDFDFPANFSCVSTVSPDVGARCDLATTVDAIVPDTIKEGKNMVLQVFRLRLKDSGLNGAIGDTDDQDFAMQGVLVP